ncbi:hypothetical protein OIU77_015279 [Salix suchowensis]|uniref:Uncharacterized protein n=1 Tax=Salix suchowensis TaxID=1278906 RepID=A0ABQ8ZSC4_9ROSI|nr:hypothetical protein OIU77_015279 [Salix suchowensis]
MAKSVPSMADSSAAASVQIVYTKRPQHKEPEAYHIRTLASVLSRVFVVLYISIARMLQRRLCFTVITQWRVDSLPS